MKKTTLAKSILFYSGILLFVLPTFAKVISFPINPPRKLNFATDDEIFRVRNKMVSKYPIFF